MTKQLNLPVINYLNQSHQMQVKAVYEDQLSTRAESGIEFAAAILLAEYLGIRVIGRISPWIRRLKEYPLAVADELLYGVRFILKDEGIELTDQGELRKIQS